MQRTYVHALALFLCLLPSAAAPAKKPRLVLTIVVDQFRYDFLTRQRAQFKSGFARLLNGGAVFRNAHYDHFPTVTAIGHATILSGAYPSISGIVENEWWDDEFERDRASVDDPGTKLVGLGATTRQGASPVRMMVSTVGDELRMLSHGSKVIGISLKNRSAILPAGHAATGAYWFDDKSGRFITSTFYANDARPYPKWMEEFNASRPVDAYLGKSWKKLNAGPSDPPLRVIPSQPGEKAYEAFTRTYFANDVLERLAEKIIEEEKLGADEEFTDILSVSFSANDLAGHDYGPDSPEVLDITLRTDGVIGKLLDYVDRRVGLNHTLIVFTADHGIPPVPAVAKSFGFSAGRIAKRALFDRINEALEARYKVKGNWIYGGGARSLYLNRGLIRTHKLNLAEVEQFAAAAARTMPHIWRVYTRGDLEANRVGNDPVDQRVRNGYHPARSANLFVITDPYWTFYSSKPEGIDHGSPFNYDSNVPVIFMGPWFRPGTYSQRIVVNDIAPTVATVLDVATPSGSVGRTLTEILIQ